MRGWHFGECPVDAPLCIGGSWFIPAHEGPFSILYFIINLQLKKEQKRFEENFSTLSEEKYNVAINQEIHKEILKHSGSKI